MTQKHTPGPWRYSLATGSYSHFRVDAGDKTPFIAAAIGEEANARLIAAAPELLACVKSQRLMLQAFRAHRLNNGLKDDHRELNEAIAETDAAIAKATGAQ